MALVMLPCELPWWSSVQTHLNKLSNTKNTLELIEGMQKIHELCNISLDPDDEETTDPELFVELLNFLDNELTSEERSNFLNRTLKNIVDRALNLKKWKPRGGLHFSLQQQPDSTDLEYNFVSSLIANAFFSTFPKRTDKSHPTLQNFNFTNFFKHLNTNAQKAKLKSLLYYFDWLDANENSVGSIRILRQVMSSKEWLTIEDWLECTLPLCQVQIKHGGRLERADENALQICFASSKVGGRVLSDGASQECISLVTFTELLSVLLHVEALEDNEVLTVERLRRTSRISDPKNRARFEELENTAQITVSCMDAENYTHLPLSQYEEDNVLRELNKCLLAFQQNQPQFNTEVTSGQMQCFRQRRLSPIGESVGSSTEPHESSTNLPIITQQSCSTNKSGSQSPKEDTNSAKYDRLKVQLETERSFEKRGQGNQRGEGFLNNRRGRFIVLGSSGERLPVKRKESSSDSSSDEYHSAKTSLEEASGDEDFNQRYSIDLETAERRQSFAQRLKDALNREKSSMTTSSESSYAVGISVAGSGVEDKEFVLRRGGSTGFMLKEDSLNEEFLNESLQHEREWIDKFKSKQPVLSKRDSNKSSEYSFSTEFSSELEEVYEQFSKWLKDPIIETDKETKRVLDQRDLAVVQFAGSLLKRTLSESFAGVPLTEGCAISTGSASDEQTTTKKNKVILNARSLSLELARQKHKLAAQLIAKASPLLEDNCKSVAADAALSDDATAIASQCSGSASNNTRKSRAISWVTEIIQTLEDICINIAAPKVFQLSQIAQKPKGNLNVVSTGNWGCGKSKSGEVQLKVIIQWLAASVAGVPALIYYTSGHKQLAKLDTVCRILIDRKWTVKDLAQATLRYSSQVLLGRAINGTLFEELIGVERNV